MSSPPIAPHQMTTGEGRYATVSYGTYSDDTFFGGFSGLTKIARKNVHQVRCPNANTVLGGGGGVLVSGLSLERVSTLINHIPECVAVLRTTSE